ncbi:MAG: glucose-6-phosphate dehydrogenase, partial [Acidobacteria bacterium]|nr:glucose-6-phosphate dehydrogenase [Acidobacteriota bacterium]
MPLGEVERHLFAVLGGTGDLMRRKLLPALFHLSSRGPLRGRCQILGAGRTQLTEEDFRQWARDALADAAVAEDKQGEGWCHGCVHYQPIGQGGAQDY